MTAAYIVTLDSIIKLLNGNKCYSIFQSQRLLQLKIMWLNIHHAFLLLISFSLQTKKECVLKCLKHGLAKHSALSKKKCSPHTVSNLINTYSSTVQFDWSSNYLPIGQCYITNQTAKTAIASLVMSVEPAADTAVSLLLSPTIILSAFKAGFKQKQGQGVSP